MCIRDSSRTVDADTEGAKNLLIGLADAGIDLKAVTDQLEAVSYTHLRAHETVLDLVCRLLLEKKKA